MSVTPDYVYKGYMKSSLNKCNNQTIEIYKTTEKKKGKKKKERKKERKTLKAA